MKWQNNKFLIFLIRIGIVPFVTMLLLLLLLAQTADWLVINNEPVKSDLGVVLGGGGGSRLKRAIDIYDKGLVDSLLLVGLKERSWNHITTYLCPDCDLTGKNVTIISGSTTTVTDAQLSLHYCCNHAIKNILIITDPYHTRRTALIFSRVFRNSGITTLVLGSRDYGNLLSPNDAWWKDINTLEVVWLELGKNLVVWLTI